VLVEQRKAVCRYETAPDFCGAHEDAVDCAIRVAAAMPDQLGVRDHLQAGHGSGGGEEVGG